MRVFVTDGNQRSSLAVVRSLGRAGIWVGVGDTAPVTLAGSSKFCTETLVHPSPLREPQKFQDYLAHELPRRGYNFLLANTDMTAQLVSALKPRLEPTVRVLTADLTRLLLLQDKGAVLEVATKLGLGVPQYLAYGGRDEALRFAELIGYPVVVKPRRSRLLCGDRWREGVVRYAHNPAELIELCESVHAQIPCPLVQERLLGEGRGVFLLMWDGELKAAFCHRRLREKPPWGGVSVLSESVEPDHELIGQSVRLLRKLDWNGPAMVEFKNDRPGGQPKLMEVNGRFWGTLRLAMDSGIDFPLMYLRLAAGENIPAQHEYKFGVQSRWLLADLDALLTRLHATDKQKALYGSEISRSKACMDFLRVGGSNIHYDVYARGDSRPAWVEWKQYLRETFEIVLRRMCRNGGGA